MAILFVALIMILFWLLSGLLAAFVSWKLDLRNIDWQDVELIDDAENFFLCVIGGLISLAFIAFVIYIQKINWKLCERFYNFFRDWAKNNV